MGTSARGFGTPLGSYRPRRQHRDLLGLRGGHDKAVTPFWTHSRSSRAPGTYSGPPSSYVWHCPSSSTILDPYVRQAAPFPIARTHVRPGRPRADAGVDAGGKPLPRHGAVAGRATGPGAARACQRTSRRAPHERVRPPPGMHLSRFVPGGCRGVVAGGECPPRRRPRSSGRPVDAPHGHRPSDRNTPLHAPARYRSSAQLIPNRHRLVTPS